MLCVALDGLVRIFGGVLRDDVQHIEGQQVLLFVVANAVNVDAEKPAVGAALKAGAKARHAVVVEFCAGRTT